MPPIGSVPFVLGVWFATIIFDFLWRQVAAYLVARDKPLGEAMGAVFS